MLNTYIKNKGITQTIVRKNNKNHFNETNWDADYDGNIANISIDTNMNGKNKHVELKLDNEDLAELLNIPSVNIPIDKRLKQDFMTPLFRNDQRILYQIEIPNVEPTETSDYIKTDIDTDIDTDTLNRLLLETEKPKSYISSPLSNEELLVPITIDDKSTDNYTLTPRRRHRRIKTHKTHRLYKRPKSYSSKYKNYKTKTLKEKKYKPRSSSYKGKREFTIF